MGKRHDAVGDSIRLAYQIARYGMAGRHGRQCETTRCPHCGFEPGEGLGFRKHGSRARTFLVIRDRMVHPVQSVLDPSMPIYHMAGGSGNEPGEAAGLAVLSHTTLYHWISALGRAAAQGEATDAAKLTVPARRKYRSDARRQVLIRCHRRCLADEDSPRPRSPRGG